MDENPKKKKRVKSKFIGITCSLLSLAMLTYIAITLISGRQAGQLPFIGLFSGSDSLEMADEFFFDVGRARVFADLNGSLAAAGTQGIQVLDSGGRETLREAFGMSYPAITAQNGRAVAFDVGGTAVRVFNKTEIIMSMDVGGAVISASINRDGWVSVCTQEGGATKGVVTVYDNMGNDAYVVRLASGYVLSAALSPSSKSLAILNLTSEGSRITHYNMNSTNVDRVFDLPGELILDIRFLTDENVLAISTNSLLIAGESNEKTELYEFAGKSLGSFVIDGDIIALNLLSDDGVHRGKVVTFGDDGSFFGEIETGEEIVSMSAGGGYLAVLRNNGLVFLSATLEEISTSDGYAPSADTDMVLALGSGIALVAGDHSAVIIRVGR